MLKFKLTAVLAAVGLAAGCEAPKVNWDPKGDRDAMKAAAGLKGLEKATGLGFGQAAMATAPDSPVIAIPPEDVVCGPVKVREIRIRKDGVREIDFKATDGTVYTVPCRPGSIQLQDGLYKFSPSAVDLGPNNVVSKDPPPPSASEDHPNKGRVWRVKCYGKEFEVHFPSKQVADDCSDRVELMRSKDRKSDTPADL